MKKITITALTLLLSLGTEFIFAQAIPNNGFENWVIAGPAESATGWAGTPGVTKSTDAHSGSFAVEIKAGIFTNPTTMAQDTLPGIANTGAQGMAPGTTIRGFAFTGRPDSLVGYYKYTPAGNDSAIFRVVLSKWNTTTNTADIISNTAFVGTSQSSYKRFAIHINYANTMTPDSANIELASSVSPPNHPALGSVLLIDDLNFTYKETVGISSNTKAESAFNVYPNPTHELLFVKINNSESSTYSVRLMDVMGRVVLSPALTELQSGINVSQFPKGSYSLQLTDDKTNQVTSKRFIIN